MTTDATELDDSASMATLPFPGMEGTPPRRFASPRRGGTMEKSGDVGEVESVELSSIETWPIQRLRLDRPKGSSPVADVFAPWFATRMPQHGPRLDHHQFAFPAPDRDDLVWDWRWSSDDVLTWIVARDEDGPVRDAGAAQLLGWFQACGHDRFDPSERLWSLHEFLYRFEPGRRWQALIGDLDAAASRLTVGWIGSFEGMVWQTARTVRAIVPTPGSLGSETMPDPMTLRLEWTGRMSLGVGPAREDLSSFRRDDRSPMPLQIHRATDRR